MVGFIIGNEEIRKLSYDEYDYEIDTTVIALPFLWAITLRASLTKMGSQTFEIFDGLVNAFDVPTFLMMVFAKKQPYLNSITGETQK